MMLATEQGETAEGAVHAMRMRRCLLTGATLPEARLVRFVASPEGAVVPDIEAKLPGRGLWLTASRSALEEAVAKKAFSKAAKAPLKADAGLASLVEKRLVAALSGTLGIAKRAGALILGFDQVAEALRSDKPPALLVEASNAASDGCRKLRSAAIGRGLTPFVLSGLTGAELSLALGRENVVHAALKSGRFAERLIFDAERLAGFRPMEHPAWPGFAGGQGSGPRVNE